MTVELLTGASAAALAGFRCRTFGEPWSELTEELVRYRLAGALARGTTTAIGIRVQGELAGVAAWQVDEHAGICRSVLVAVRNRDRGQGHGRLLKESVVAAARHAGAAAVVSHVPWDATRMLRINEQLGANVERLFDDREHCLCVIPLAVDRPVVMDELVIEPVEVAVVGAPPPDVKLHGLPVDRDVTYVDRFDATHRLFVAGPYLHCVTHSGAVRADTLASTLAAVAHRRACDRIRVAWQRRMLADDRTADPALRSIPAELRSYLAEQTARHAERLDAALGRVPDADRVRQRWHRIGWRAAPTLAARYQAMGVEAGVAFLALRRHIDPVGVAAAINDPDSVIAKALRTSKRRGYTVEQLDLRFSATVTDDFPYEPMA